MLQKGLFWAHAVMIPLGAFICVGGTYGVIEEIIRAYADGQIGEFSLSSFHFSWDGAMLG